MSDKSTDLLDQALDVLQAEINYIKEEAKKEALRDGRARVLAEYIRTLVSVSKDNTAKAEKEEEDLKKLSDDELIAQAEAAMKSIKKDKGVKNGK